MGKCFEGLNIKKLSLFSIIICAGLLMFACGNGVALFQKGSEFFFAFCFMASFLMCAFCVLLWLLSTEKISTATALIISASVLAVCYLFLFPPITVPDEQAHYLSAYRLSNYLLLDFSGNRNDAILMRECDLRLFETLLPNVDGEYIKTIYQEVDFCADDIKKVWYECSFVSNAPFSYVLSALGIAVARVLNLGALATIFFGRIMNLAGFTALLAYATKKIPVGKTVLPMIAALPIVLHLSASLSYDSITLGFAFVFISQVIYIRQKKEVATIKDIIILTVFAMLLAPSKLVYFPMVLLVFIIPADRFGLSKKKSLSLKWMIVILAASLLIALQFSSVASISESQSSGWTDEPPYNLKWILTNPFSSCKILLNTLRTFSLFYIKNLFGGLLGWLNVNVPIYLWLPQMLLVLSGSLRYKNEDEIFTTGQKVWAWLCLAATAALIMLSMFLAWTPMGSGIIYGVQGRYFLPLLLPLFLVLRCKRFALCEGAEKYISMAYMAFGFATVINLFLIVTS